MLRLPTLAATAFAVGLLSGALLVPRLSSLAPAADARGPEEIPSLVAHVENVGARPLRAQVQVLDAEGATWANETFSVPAHGGVDMSVFRVPEGAYRVVARFMVGAAGVPGEARLETSDCGAGGTPLARFTLGTDQGVRLLAVAAGCWHRAPPAPQG